MEPMKPMQPMQKMDFGPPWWPQDLGQPATSGAQNGTRYAVFPSRQRLLIERNGKLTTYDTGDHRIGGVSQQSTADSTVTFTSQNGPVSLDELKQLG